MFPHSFTLKAAQMIAFAGCFALSPQMVCAQDVLLTISIEGTDERFEITDDMLLQLEQQSFQTSSLWTEGSPSYSGPSLTSVLSMVGIHEQNSMTFVGANDYKVDISPALIDDTYPIIANRIDGMPFSLREKGPLWIMYPFDKRKEYQTEPVYGAAVWQLVEIRVLTSE
ncbi:MULTISPECIES: oxidoreductase [Roseobacteraceae]|uniref:Oxidoreductase n=2 Tax=Celeribacter baekdonensis TaxID=875171 RepID=A0A2R4M2S1_9RHOB|nr:MULTISPECIES: oxidoreductase [Roseobacteraceae]AVW91352.1 oxidoreductase [Celeribacter baekdonensis]KAB6718160.1 oxidoreductase [Roseobacter sp. TSBP12]